MLLDTLLKLLFEQEYGKISQYPPKKIFYFVSAHDILNFSFYQKTTKQNTQQLETRNSVLCFTSYDCCDNLEWLIWAWSHIVNKVPV